ncbi:MAG TPA: DUF167 domain-containing protein [Phycisphaerae bacterium]|nr:DUF167 domain-containing protein [Phycisphaerae bacterium]
MKHIELLRIRPHEAGAVLAVKVVPGSSRDKVAGVLGDCLKVSTAAAAEKGKANAAVARLLAEALGVDRRCVRLHAGPTSPRKEFLIVGLPPEDVRRRLGGQPP